MNLLNFGSVPARQSFPVVCGDATWIKIEFRSLEVQRPIRVSLIALLPPLAFGLVMCVLQEIGKVYDNMNEATDAAIEYFKTADFAAVPYVRISSLLLAGLSRRAVSGQMRPPSRGMVNDIRKLFAQIRGLVGGGLIKSSQSQLTS